MVLYTYTCVYACVQRLKQKYNVYLHTAYLYTCTYINICSYVAVQGNDTVTNERIKYAHCIYTHIDIDKIVVIYTVYIYIYSMASYV